MTLSQRDGLAQFLREKRREAVNLAMESRWEEAVEVNHTILQVAPEDTEACNRLGKAFMELGRYGEARDAFQQALALRPSNAIARKNLERLEHLEAAAPKVKRGEKVSASIFLEESGKACVARLLDLAPRDVLAAVSAGDTVYLNPRDNTVWVESPRGERLGRLEPRLGLRLSRLIQGGNEYAAAVTTASEGEVAIIIRETRQHPDQVGIVSFPGKAGVGYPSFLEEFPIPYDRGEEAEIILDRDEMDEEGPEPPSSAYLPTLGASEEEEEEF